MLTEIDVHPQEKHAPRSGFDPLRVAGQPKPHTSNQMKSHTSNQIKWQEQGAVDQRRDLQPQGAGGHADGQDRLPHQVGLRERHPPLRVCPLPYPLNGLKSVQMDSKVFRWTDRGRGGVEAGRGLRVRDRDNGLKGI